MGELQVKRTARINVAAFWCYGRILQLINHWSEEQRRRRLGKLFSAFS